MMLNTHPAALLTHTGACYSVIPSRTQMMHVRHARLLLEASRMMNESRHERLVQERMHKVRQERLSNEHEATSPKLSSTAGADLTPLSIPTAEVHGAGSAVASPPASSAAPAATARCAAEPSSQPSSTTAAGSSAAELDGRVHDLKALLEQQPNGLTPGQRRFCCDGTLARFVRAHCGDSKPASKALGSVLSTLKWREAQGFDPDPAAAPPRCCEYCDKDDTSHCFFSIGQDQRGWEVLYCCPPRSRLKDPASSSAHAFKCIEAAMERATPQGPGTGKFLLAVDLHGLGFRDLDPRTAALCVPALISHYPGQIGQVAILDSPLAFKVAWAAIAPMLDAGTAARVQMLRGDAMGRYFRDHLTQSQADFLNEIIRMKSAPGSLPASIKTLLQPLDNAKRV